MSLTRIRKRNDEVVDFDRKRIEEAIELACNAVGEIDKSFIPVVTDFIVKDLDHVYTEIFVNRLPSVEDVQDIVERNLMKFNKFEVAKEYIIYRASKKEERVEAHEKLVKKFEKNGFKVTKSNGSKEEFDYGKIEKMFKMAVKGYESQCVFDDLMEAFKKNIVEDMKTSDIAKLLVKTCIDLVSVENIAWEHVAGRLALFDLYKKAGKNRNIKQSEIYTADSYLAFFNAYIADGLYYKDFMKYYSEDDIRKAGEVLAKKGKITDMSYGYTTVLSLAKRYLLNPNKVVKELPQELYMSVALFYAIPEKAENRLKFAFQVYEYCSEQKISLATPALINPRTNWHQLTSCFKLNIADDLRAIYHGIEDIAQISKFGGGVGVYLGRIRSQGAEIRGIKGAAGGVNPWVKVINDTAVAVNQLGTRLGAVSVTLDVWHRDIYEFLELQTETGDIRSKAFDVFPAISVPDLFMRRVEEDGDWTLFDPYQVGKKYGKTLEDHFDKEFEAFYAILEADNTLDMKKTVKAKDLFKAFLKTTVETGMPYVFYRDTVNRVNPNKHCGNIYSTQLCTEICQNSSPAKFIEETIEDGQIVIRYEPGETVTCNISSINVAKVYEEKEIEKALAILSRILDNIISLSKFPIKAAELTAYKYRAIGIGYLGLAEYLATRSMAYDSLEARTHVDGLFELYTYYTYKASVDLAKERGHYPLFPGSEHSKGIILGKDAEILTKETYHKHLNWKALLEEMKKTGTRFGYHSAPAPNTSTAGIVGTTAALLPIYKKYFVETNLASPTIRIAPKLNAENFWYYKEYVTMDMNDVIDMISVIYKWIDQSISFEWMIDPAKVSPRELYGYYIKSWKQGIKTVYYVRSLSSEISAENCVSCSG
ncbi:ribonucleoside-diphosphate reductase subunit alpha [Candidatus Gracilibacteria bacterium]|nr:ribonucleoside-diphosphate reductase subunit alpha [Candidatus Gracilibacteria bacterium]